MRPPCKQREMVLSEKCLGICLRFICYGLLGNMIVFAQNWKWWRFFHLRGFLQLQNFVYVSSGSHCLAWLIHCNWTYWFYEFTHGDPNIMTDISLGMESANKIRRCIITPLLICWAHGFREWSRKVALIHLFFVKTIDVALYYLAIQTLKQSA